MLHKDNILMKGYLKEQLDENYCKFKKLFEINEQEPFITCAMQDTVKNSCAILNYFSSRCGKNYYLLAYTTISISIVFFLIAFSTWAT